MTVTLVQTISGIGINPIATPTAGSLLVVAVAHRQEPITPESPGEGYELRSVHQFSNSSTTRSGVAIWSKISEGNEDTVTLNFGTSSDLGGIFSEFSSAVNLDFIGGEGATSGTSTPSSLTCLVEPAPSASSLAIAAVVVRNADAVTSWDSGFESSIATRPEMGMAWNIDVSSVPDNDVTATFTGDIETSNIVTASFESLPTFVVSGKVTNGGVPVEGAQVMVVETANPDGTGATRFVGRVTTDVNGDWAAELVEGRGGFISAFAKDGLDLFVSQAHGFIEEPGP